MKLTNTLRDAFIRAVMNDVPEIDYDDQIRTHLLEEAVAKLPTPLQDVWRKNSDLRPYFNTVYIRRYTGSHYIGVHAPYAEEPDEPFDSQKLKELCAKAQTQHKLREDLRTRLRACAYGATTRAALAKMLPEFEKYLPADEAAACRTLPAVANVVADFVRAGWPKNEVQHAADHAK